MLVRKNVSDIGGWKLHLYSGSSSSPPGLSHQNKSHTGVKSPSVNTSFSMNIGREMGISGTNYNAPRLHRLPCAQVGIIYRGFK